MESTARIGSNDLKAGSALSAPRAAFVISPWWALALLLAIFILCEHLCTQPTMAHSISLQLTFLCYLIAVKINAHCTTPISLPELFTHQLTPALREAMLATIIIFGLILLFRMIYLQLHPDQPFIELDRLDPTYLAYLWVAPVQELTARGIIQTQISRGIKRHGAEYYAILGSAALFAALHLFYSIAFALASFAFAGLCGVLFMRHRNIIGISILHVMVGNFAGVTGLWAQLEKSPW
ncbi:MAG: hypothetical protein C1943_14915 [Halochromatium sp.]|nr:hypothetical protein [Halochromatium sp.]